MEHEKVETSRTVLSIKERQSVCGIVVLCWLVVIGWSQPAAAQTESTAAPSSRGAYQDSALSIAPMAGFNLGFGGKVRAGARFGVQASIGASPIIAVYNDMSRTGSLFAKENEVYFGISRRISAVPFLRIWREPGSKVDLSLGPVGQFDSILGFGMGLTALVEVWLSQNWSLDLDWGTSYFPRADERLVSSRRVSANADFDFPPGLQWGLDVGISYRL